jgi:hypothetical protein
LLGGLSLLRLGIGLPCLILEHAQVLVIVVRRPCLHLKRDDVAVLSWVVEVELVASQCARQICSRAEPLIERKRHAGATDSSREPTLSFATDSWPESLFV